MGITKSVYVDTGVYKHLDSIDERVYKDAERRAKKIWEDAGLNPDDFVIEQKVIIRNYLIRKKK